MQKPCQTEKTPKWLKTPMLQKRPETQKRQKFTQRQTIKRHFVPKRTRNNKGNARSKRGNIAFTLPQ